MARRPSTAHLAAAAVGVLTVVGCTGGGGSVAPATTTAPTTTTTTPPRTGDSELKIGILLPTSDPVIGEPLIAAALDAVAQINETGGVLEQDVVTVVADEGATTAAASESIRMLIAEDVDAIVGPASSLIALSTLDEIVSAGIVACSPTASALALDDFPDRDLFFRTIPSDSLQAEAIADRVESIGATMVGMVHVDDAYGRPFAEAVTQALRSRRITVVETITFDERSDDLVAPAQAVVDSGAQVAVVLADGQDGTNFLSALDQVDNDPLVRVVVNDAMRNPPSPQVIQGLDPDLRDRILGVGPKAAPAEGESYEPSGFYAVNAVDCVNLVALAAMQVDSDAPRDIAGQMAAVSAGGAPCASFADCASQRDQGFDFDYEGPSGLTELVVRRGDPRIARFQEFVFDETGRDVTTDTFTAGA